MISKQKKNEISNKNDRICLRRICCSNIKIIPVVLQRLDRTEILFCIRRNHITRKENGMSNVYNQLLGNL